MWDDDEDDQPQPRTRVPGQATTVLLWLFFANTFRVLVPAIGCMLLGIWVGKKIGHVQAAGIAGTLVGLGVAGLLIWQQARSSQKRR